MKFNKIIASVLSVCLFGAVGINFQNNSNFYIIANAEEEYTEVTEDYLTFEVYADRAEVSKCDRTAKGELIIPSEINDVPVTSISEEAFYGCTILESITIPNSVNSIGNAAFVNCTSLEIINIPNSVTSIGISAFVNCTSIESITIPDSVTSISEYAFAGCESLEIINIPNSVTSINGWAFARTKWIADRQEENPLVIVNNILIDGTKCSGDIIIPNSVTSIGGWAFGNCTSLKSINIPNSVTSIGEAAFFGCESLTDVYYNETEEEWEKIYMVRNGSNTDLLNATIHFNSSENEQTAYGDANLDGNVTISDAVAILQYLANSEKFPLVGQALINADVDGVAGVTGKDATAIQLLDAGVVDSLPLS